MLCFRYNSMMIILSGRFLSLNQDEGAALRLEAINKQKRLYFQVQIEACPRFNYKLEQEKRFKRALVTLDLRHSHWSASCLLQTTILSVDQSLCHIHGRDDDNAPIRSQYPHEARCCFFLNG